MKHSNPKNIVVVETHKVRSGAIEACSDSLSVEEPLEIKIEFGDDSNCSRKTQSVAVTMRTPGNDAELAVGFLFAESIIESYDQIEDISQDRCNGVTILIKPGVQFYVENLERHSFINSSCGVCGKKSVESVMKRSSLTKVPTDFEADSFSVNASVFATMSRSLRMMQSDFDTTGGIHASALFTSAGRLIDLREDVGRHNALDKLIGAMLMQSRLPVDQTILFLSGRASFELIQKAVNAGIRIVAAVGAPSSLAVELASEAGITLVGFVREDRFNIYCGADRIDTIRSECSQVPSAC
jgi:FdhD protein